MSDAERWGWRLLLPLTLSGPLVVVAPDAVFGELGPLARAVGLAYFAITAAGGLLLLRASRNRRRE